MADALTGDQLQAALAAAAHPLRIRILALLTERSDYVSNLAREVGIGRPLLHMHLKKLEEAGLVTGRLELSEDGKALKYFDVVPFSISLTPATFVEAAATLSDTTTNTGNPRTNQKGQT